MSKTFNKVKDYLQSSIRYLTSPKEWVKSYELALQFFPHLKTLIVDDIDLDKITEFVAKSRKEGQVYKIITIVALINGAIAFVPGQMGIGVAICRALEAYMAYEIAKTVGIKFESKNFVKLILATGIVTVSVFWVMKTFLSFAFSFTGGLFVPAEIIATNFLGVFFFLAFEELHKFKDIKSLSFTKSLSISYKAVKHTYNLAKAQISVIGDIGSKIKTLSKNIWSIIHFKKNHEQLIKGDFNNDIKRIKKSKKNRLYLFLGSTLGNFNNKIAINFLDNIANLMNKEDSFLLGVDKVKDEKIINSAYNDSKGITKKFNKNILRVINKEYKLNFNENNFLHNAKFNSEKSQIEMYLESTVDHSVKLPNDENLNIEKGEKILTEISRKFSEKTLRDLFSKANLEIKKSYTDNKKYFSLYLLKSKKYL